jgi:hypothetical protein
MKAPESKGSLGTFAAIALSPGTGLFGPFVAFASSAVMNLVTVGGSFS